MRVFVDTSAWCAYFNKKDTNHDRAIAHWEHVVREAIALYTSDYIFDEVITLLRKRVSFLASKEVGERLLVSTLLKRLNVAPRELLLAWEWYKKYKDHDLSFTDCTSFVLMRAHRIDTAWTFDAHFTAVGFAALA